MGDLPIKVPASRIKKLPAVRTFKIEPEVVERAEHWVAGHGPCPRERMEREIQWRISDTTGGLGHTIHIACLSCDRWLDVTDYDSF